MAAGKKKKKITYCKSEMSTLPYILNWMLCLHFCICFTIAHNEWLAGKLLSHSAVSNSKRQELLPYIFLGVLSAFQKSAAAAGPGRVSCERMLVGSQLAVEATGDGCIWCN